MKRNFNFDELNKKIIDSDIIAMGKTHKHLLKGNSEVYKNLEDESLLLKVLDESIIVHEEHKKVELLPMNYKRRFVREYDHLKEEARIIRD